MNDKQLKQLFAPINPRRVKKLQGKFSYLETWDVIAHLNRIFGFLGWDKEVKTAELVFESESNDRWTVCYRATVRLVVNADLYATRKISEDCATGEASNQPKRGEAHDLALKTAVSEALKRAAKDLGNQFGLSLYDNGSTASVVGMSLAYPTQDGEKDAEGRGQTPGQADDDEAAG
jgi:DNA recombination protein Rad52